MKKDLSDAILEQMLFESSIMNKLNFLRNKRKQIMSYLKSKKVDTSKLRKISEEIAKEIRPKIKEYKSMGAAGGKKLGEDIIRKSKEAAMRNKKNVLIKEDPDPGAGMLFVVAAICLGVLFVFITGGMAIPAIMIPGVLAAFYIFMGLKVMDS